MASQLILSSSQVLWQAEHCIIGCSGTSVLFAWLLVGVQPVSIGEVDKDKRHRCTAMARCLASRPRPRAFRDASAAAALMRWSSLGALYPENTH
eukprot:6179166-Pleurochrysis_carterae.AAC.3